LHYSKTYSKNHVKTVDGKIMDTKVSAVVLQEKFLTFEDDAVKINDNK
jgi:hypothetical protein